MQKDELQLEIESNLLKAIQGRLPKENTNIGDFVSRAIEKQYLWPFLSRRHMKNYYYLNDVLAIDKNYSKNRQVLFYILAYDGIYMEYVEKIYRIVNNKEVVSIPRELNDILHPGFCLIDAACEFFTKGAIANMENGFKWFKYDNNEMIVTLNALMLMKDFIRIQDELYSPEMFQENLEKELDHSYSFDEYINSKVFQNYGVKMQQVIKELFSELKQNDMQLRVMPCKQDELTFSLFTSTSNRRLALISSSDDGSNLRIGINKWENASHGNMLYCYDTEGVAAIVKDNKIPDSDLWTKYKEL